MIRRQRDSSAITCTKNSLPWVTENTIPLVITIWIVWQYTWFWKFDSSSYLFILFLLNWPWSPFSLKVILFVVCLFVCLSLRSQIFKRLITPIYKDPREKKCMQKIFLGQKLRNEHWLRFCNFGFRNRLKLPRGKNLIFGSQMPLTVPSYCV